MSLDHGLLNLPIAMRTSCIDAQVDKYKAGIRKQQREEQKARAAQHKQQKTEALKAIEAMTDERAAELMAKFGMTRKQLTAKLERIAHYTPAVILRGI